VLPVGQWVDVVVDPQPREPVGLDGGVEVLRERLAGLGQAEVQNPAAITGGGQHPLRVLCGDARAYGYSLGLEPEQEAEARVLHRLADAPKAVGEAVRGLHGLQGEAVVAHALREAAGSGPVGIEPEDLEAEALEGPQVREDVVFIGRVELVERGAQVRDGRQRRLAILSGHDVLKHRLPEAVVGLLHVASCPQHLEDAWPPEALTGMQGNACGLETGLTGQHTIAQLRGGRPLPGPADRGHDARLAPVESVERRDAGGAAIAGAHLGSLSRRDGLVEGQPVIGLADRAVEAVECYCTGEAEREACIESAQVLDGRGVRGAGVGELKRPVHPRRVGVDGGDHRHLQPGSGVGEGECRTLRAVADGLRGLGALPGVEELRRALPTVGEGEGEARDGCHLTGEVIEP